MKPLSLIEKAFFLKKVRLFSELELDLLLAIAEKLHHDDYDADEQIFNPGQVANRIYFIVQGSVQIADPIGRALAELGPADYFGDESLFNDLPRAYGARCRTDTLFLTLSRSHLLSAISECPSISISLLQSFAHAFPCRFAKTPLPGAAAR
jgi:CRP-like cAMP-binding protein